MNFSTLRAELTLNVSRFLSGMSQAASAARNVGTQMNNTFGSSTQSNIRGVQNSVRDLNVSLKDTKRIVGGIIISQVFYQAVGAIRDARKELFEFMGDIERFTLASETILGGKNLARGFIANMQDLAATTAFETRGAIEFAQRLIASGFEPQSIRSVMEIINDTASALGSGTLGLDRISLALAQIKAGGVLKGQEVRQLYEARIPIYEILREQLGLTPKQLSELGELQIDADTAIQAILRGMKQRYEGLAEYIALETMPGLLETLKDNTMILSAALAEPLYEGLKENIVRPLRNLSEDAREAFQTGGIGAVFEMLFPPALQSSIRRILGSLRAIMRAFAELGSAIKPVVVEGIGMLIHALSAVLPVIAMVVTHLSRLVVAAFENIPGLRYLASAIFALMIANTVAKALMFLWGVLRIGAIASAVAAAVMQLVSAIRFLLLLLVRSPILRVVAAFVAGLLAIANAAGVATAWIEKLKKAIDLEGIFGEDIFKPIKNDTKELAEWFNKDVLAGEDLTKIFREMGKKADETGKKAEKAGKKVNDKFVAAFDEVFQVPDKLDDLNSRLNDLDADLDEIDFPSLGDIPSDLFDVGMPDIDPPSLGEIPELWPPARTGPRSQRPSRPSPRTPRGWDIPTFPTAVVTAIGTVNDALANLKNLLTVDLPEWVLEGLGAVGRGFADAGQRVWDWVLDTGGKIWDWVGETSGAFAGWALDTGLTIWGWVTDTAGAFLGWATDTGLAIWGWVGDTAGAFFGWAADTGVTVWNWVADTGGAIAGWVLQTAGNFGSWAIEAGGHIWGWAVGTAGNIWDWVTETGGAIGGWAINTAGNIGAWALDTASNIGSWVLETAGTIGEWAYNTGINVYNWALTGAKNIAAWATDTATNLSKWAAETSKSVYQWAANTAKNLVSWVTTGAKNIATWVRTTAKDIGSWVKETVKNLGNWAVAAGKNVLAFGKTGYHAIREWARASWGNFKSWMEGTGNGLVRWANNALNAIISFARSAWSAIKELAASVGETLGYSFQVAGDKIKSAASSIGNWVGSNAHWLLPAAAITAVVVSGIATMATGGAATPALVASLAAVPIAFSVGADLSTPYQYARGGIVDFDHIARVGEGGKREAIIPLENSHYMRPFSAAVARDLYELMGGDNLQEPSTDDRPILYVGTLIADDRSLRELERRLQIVRTQEQDRGGGRIR